MVKKLILAIVVSVLVLCGAGMLICEYNSLDNRLWRRLVEDRPELKKCSDEYEKVDIIRDWAYENAFFAGHRETYSSESADIYIKKLLDGEDISYGYYCGGIASVLSHVYTYLGYPACSLDLAAFEGEQVLFSHVVTLVYVNGEWIVQDPTFNLTYTDETGKHLTVGEVQDRVREERQVLVENGDTQYANCIMTLSTYEGDYEVKGEGEKTGNYYVYKQETEFDKMEQKIIRQHGYFFDNKGWERDAMLLYTCPYGLYFPNEYGKYVKSADEKYETLKKEIFSEDKSIGE